MRMAKGPPMPERKFGWIPLSRIRLLGARTRDRVEFAEALLSITGARLLKPIIVNEHSLQRTGYYELVTGNGRLQAYAELKKKQIPAEVINCDRRTARLISSFAPIIRPSLKPLTVAREMKRMKDCGLSLSRISEIVHRSKSHVADAIRLIESGDKRLIEGTEQKCFDLPFALRVARSAHGNIRKLLMDASDAGIIDWTQVDQVRHAMERRLSQGLPLGRSSPGESTTYTEHDLRRDIADAGHGQDDHPYKGKSTKRFICNIVKHQHRSPA